MERSSGALLREILGVAAAILALLFLLALLSFSPADEGLLGRGLPVSNWVGSGGVWLANKALMAAFGLSAYLLPLALMVGAIVAFLGTEPPTRRTLLVRGAAFFFLTLFASAALALAPGQLALRGETIAAGGVVGTVMGGALRQSLNLPGATVLTGLGLLVSFMILTRFSLRAAARGGAEALGRLRALVVRLWQSWRTESEREKREEHVAQIRKTISEAHVQEEPEIHPSRSGEVRIDAKIRQPKKRAKEPKPSKAEKEQAAFAFVAPPTNEGPGVLPSTELLDFEPEVNRPLEEEQLKANAKILEKKLLDFGIQGQVVAIEPGPVITMYEFLPAPGVKVSKVSGLQDDLAMALSAISIRIIAPIPGKNVIGIEIPNRQREQIFLRELLENTQFQDSKSKTLLALGKDTSGVPFYWDLQKMPHLLIAGATGAGKSVGLNGIILSILYRAFPADVKLILVDPKMLELSVYEGIPHLYASVVTDPRKAASALRWAVTEMERRYKLLADYGVRNLENYNKLIRKELSDGSWRERARRRAELERQRQIAMGGAEGAEAADPCQEELIEPPEDLPLLLIVIDELADLMMLVGKEVEESITRLAQMARASGIHLILATQRPSVDVITGLIKANFPARMSFQVTSRTDSRTILDAMGAEQLLGRGDMLFSPPGTSKLVRVHGAFVSDDEVHRVVEFLKQTGEAHYHDQILEIPPDLQEGGFAEDDEPADPLYEQAVRIVVESSQASTSYVQRRLKVGYNRAARMIERMERDGIVGPSDGVRPREILMGPIEIEERFQAVG